MSVDGLATFSCGKQPRIEEPDDPVSPKDPHIVRAGHRFDERSAKSVLVNYTIIYPQYADAIREKVSSLIEAGRDIPSIEQIVREKIEQISLEERARHRQLWDKQSRAHRDVAGGEAVQIAQDSAELATKEYQARAELRVRQIAQETAQISGRDAEALRQIREKGAADVQQIKSRSESETREIGESAEAKIQRIAAETREMVRL
ncbi:MAG: hypothetical protein LBS68_03850, partial [Puniceicoccales bacterium]|nr:hypothetical protein [Puniceicoccales bacterium]